MRFRTKLKNTITDHTKSDILTGRLVLWPVDWDKNGLLFTKRLQMMNQINGYPNARTIINSIQLCGTHQANVFIYFSGK